MSLEEQLLETDLDRIQSAVESIETSVEEIEEALGDHQTGYALDEARHLLYLSSQCVRLLKAYRLCRKELGTANASPKARKRTPEAR